MNDLAETVPLLEGGLNVIQEAAKHLTTVGIDHKVTIAGDGVPGS